MKILWLNHRDILHPRAGGAERTQFELSRRLVRAGDSITLATVQWTGALPEENVEGVRIVRAPGNLEAHLGVPKLIRQMADADVIVEDLAHVVPWLSNRLSSIPGVAYFRHLHARTLPGQVNRIAVPILRLVERTYPALFGNWPFVTESRDSVKDLLALGVEEGRIRRISPGVDCDQFRPGTRSPNPTLFYYSGFRRYKRPDHAIRALARVRSLGSRASLLVVGDGPELPSVKALSRELGVSDAVHFTGRLSTDRLADALRGSWVNLVCSTAEGWGLTALEAAASGVPTVSYDVPGLRDAVVPGVTGQLVRDGEVDELSRAILSVMGEQSEWGSKCRAFALQSSWSTVSLEWRRLLSEVKGS